MNVVEQIRREFAADQDERRIAVSLSDVPTAYDRISPEWFSAILCKNHPGAAVDSFTLGPADDGSTNRRRVYLVYNAAGIRAGLPDTVFCKAAMEVENRVMLGMGGASLCETNFYHLVRKKLDVDAPTALHAAFDPRSYGYIVVMRDLTNEVHFCTEQTVITRDQAEDMVTQLARLHAAFYQHRDLGMSSLPFPRWADWWRLTEEADFERCCANGIEAARHVVPERLYRDRARLWKMALLSAARHREMPETITHMDGHLSNWYARPSGTMGLCDWQFVCVGNGSRDLVYAIATGLQVQDRRAWEQDLIRLYIDRMAAFGVPGLSFEETFRNCRQQLFTPLAFWTYVMKPADGMPDMQAETRIVEYIRRMSTAIDDLDSMTSFD